jgi:hypothetical protein
MTRDGARSNPGPIIAPRTRRLAEAIVRRWRVREAVGLVAWALVAAGIVAVVLVLAARWLGAASWAIWVVAALTLAAAAGAVAYAGLRARSLERAAAAADGHAGLKDALVSALLLSKHDAEDRAFASLAVARGEAAAEGVSPAEVVPIRLGVAWAVWPLAVALAFVSAIYVPPWGPRTNAEGASVATADPQETERARQGIEELARALEGQAADAAQGNEGAADPQVERQLDRLREIEEELAAGGRDPQEALTEAAAVATDAADAMERAARERELANEALRDALANLERTADRKKLEEDSLSGAAERLADALERGDLARAAEAAEELAQRSASPETSETERQEAARRMRALADRLDRPGKESPGDASATPPPTESEQPSEPSSGETETQPSEPPAQQGETEAPREDPNERASRDARERQHDLSESLREAADRVEGGEPSEPAEEDQAPPRDGEGAQQPQQEPGQQQQQQLSQGRDPAQQQGQEPGQQQQGQEPGQQQQGQEPGQQQQGQEPGQQQSGQEPGQQQQGQEPGQQQPGQESGQQQTGEPGQTGERPGGEPGGEQMERQAAEGEGGQDGQPGRRGLSERLRELADRPGDAQQQQQRARELRERAREAFDRMSPQEQQEMLERLREQQAGEPGGDDRGATPEPGQPGEGEPSGALGGEGPATGELGAGVDPWQRELMDLPERGAGDQDAGMRTVAEWFGQGRDTPGAGGSAVADDVRRAARGAQDAIERERVPRRRSDLIRRVFERYAEQLSETRDASSGAGR